MSTNFLPRLYTITATYNSSNSSWTYSGDISNGSTSLSVNTALSIVLVTLSGGTFVTVPVVWGSSASSTVPTGLQVVTLSTTQIYILNWNTTGSGSNSFSIKTDKSTNPPDPTIVNTPVT
jgi:hypothetical protein